MINLVVGDVHCTPDELEDCERLLSLVVTTIDKNRDIDTITFLGDQFNTHDVLNVRCIELWRRYLELFAGSPNIEKIILMVGNHDQVTPTSGYPHSMISFVGMNKVTVVDKPVVINGNGFMPYYFDHSQFIEAFNALNVKTVYCHQTFQGALFENAFYAPDGIDLALLNNKKIISGHIHLPQEIGRVTYVGAPRWRTRSDADIDRKLSLYNGDGDLINTVNTGIACSVIRSFAIRVDSEITAAHFEHVKAWDKTLIDIYGPDKAYVDEMQEAVKKLVQGKKVVFRMFADNKKAKLKRVSEKEGIQAAFDKFLNSFAPPKGTSKERLRQMLHERGGI